MKTNPVGSSLETCRAAGQGEKGCPVCQACGGASGLGSASGSGSGLEPGPGAVLGSGLGPGAIPGPGPGPGAVPGSGPGPSAVSVTGLVPGASSGPTATLGPALGAGPLPGSGARSGPRPGAESVPGLVPQPGAGTLPQPGAGPVPQPGAGSVPQLGNESVPRPGAAPLPGLGPVPGTRRGSGTGSHPSESVTPPEPALQQKTQAKPTQGPRQKVLVTGGGGYLGFSLGSSLAKRGISVILLDLRRPQWPLPSGTEFIQADVRDEEALYQAFQGVDCVFHVASYGMSGAEKLQKQQIESINVGGTRLVINVCVRRRVPRLVYTSTVNVTFGGKPIEQGDEDSVPYFPLDKHMDHYSRTKAIADQLTLMANGTPLLGGGTLRTCVLRPPGIYGPEEQRHLPRVANHIKKRLFMFRFGDRRTRMNWVHVQNLVQAHMLAAEALTMAKGYVASGQAYYINDGDSVNLFEWMAPLFEKLGYSQPWIWVPTSCVYLTAALMEYLHLALRPICTVPPLLTRSEVLSVAVTHTFQIAKARAQLGYAPDKFSFADAVERYVQATTQQPRGFTTLTLLRLLLLLLGLLGLLGLTLHFLGLQPLQTAVQHL
ncbi:LOW QUALITY PROTEIN: putative short-chain dehydrogenase/reductase family 42E member 2 [Peromyscus californicus insignis]|uniref:LOW QUALITY PROTEIN: putative short-chain dehydrogenase/reductase family 42E member 2 n=1 Tax=Peromyscus californicus insignis TaxID=564181 RepID=UPI0022A78BFD|nr:LOW QUALITY PROTEIN: putative short-chain dehydrogenase/reductase family 42E member 2 [Peromyscus californicus insignis]